MPVLMYKKVYHFHTVLIVDNGKTFEVKHIIKESGDWQSLFLFYKRSTSKRVHYHCSGKQCVVATPE